MKEKRAQELSAPRRNMQSRNADALLTPAQPDTALGAGISPGGHEGRTSGSEVQLWRRVARSLIPSEENKGASSGGQ